LTVTIVEVEDAICHLESLIEAHVAELKKPIRRNSNGDASANHVHIKRLDERIERFKVLKKTHQILTDYRERLG